MKTSAPRNRRAYAGVRALLLFTFVISAAAPTLRAQGSALRVETFTLKPGGEVSVENARGATRIESWEQETVRIVAEKKLPAGSAIEPGELVLMGAQNSIIIQCRQGAGRIDLTVYLPSSARLQSTGGSWPVDLSGALASAVVETTSGNIAYRLPSNDDARVAMRSQLGTVRTTIPLAGMERTGTRSLQGQLGSGSAQIILSSTSGNITLTPGSAVAKLPNKGTQVYAGSQSPMIASPEQENAGSVVSETPGLSGRSPANPPNRGDSAVNPRGGNSRPAAGNGSVGFAGSDRSDDASSTTTIGPFVRPRSERNTSGGNSGLNARIIPSNSAPSVSAEPRGSVFDQAEDDKDFRGNDRSSAKGSPSTQSSAPSYPASGSVVFAGSDRANDGTTHSRVGPLERDRQSRDTGGGNSGLRVRIIPANEPPRPSRDTTSVFDPRDDSTQAQSAGIPTRRSSGANSDRIERSDQVSSNSRGDVTTRSDTEREQGESASTGSRRGSPPQLNRSRPDDSSVPAEAVDPERTAKSSDEDAIVLKAALVNLNVSVTNRAGAALGNLKKEDFEVAENSEPQKIEFFQPTAAPFNLVLALDLSGSIKDKLDIVKSAALRFVEVLGPQDKVAVVTFTDEIRVVSQLTSDRDELKRRIKMIDRSQGGTAFYEALWFSLVDTLRGTRGQRNAIVVMTDGVDSSLDRYNPMQSRVSFNQLAHKLEEADVIVFPIYLDTEYEEVFERGNSSSEAYAIARDQLERVGEMSGGQMFKAEKASDLSGVYKQVAAAIRTVYSVGYYPTNPERDGTFRRVRVQVNRSDAAVRTRKGYYAK
ncbi:MAG: VWA domain-containing protein [Blastocatellia bacterium]